MTKKLMQIQAIPLESQMHPSWNHVSNVTAFKISYISHAMDVLFLLSQILGWSREIVKFCHLVKCSVLKRQFPKPWKFCRQKELQLPFTYREICRNLGENNLKLLSRLILSHQEFSKNVFTMIINQPLYNYFQNASEEVLNRP